MESIAVFGPKHGSQLSLRSRTNSFPVTKLPRFPLTSFISKPAKLVPLRATTTLRCDDQEITRKFKKTPPCEWTHHFESVPFDVSEMDVLRRDIDALKPKVKNMLMFSQDFDSMKKKILLIYLLVSLGLGFHFEDEIEETLKQSFENINDTMDGEDDLYTVSIIFWVFRTFGYNMSSDVFKRFQMSNGKFKETLVGDATGMLSLYEASHLRTNTDYIMEEALRFASYHLESLAADKTCPSHISMRIKDALLLSQHWKMEIVVATEYISFYEQEDDHDQLLLNFAKISFNFIQLHYIQELKILTKWCKGLDLDSKLPPYIRNKIVENHFLVLAMYFEPQFSRERIMLTKFFTVALILDDTCDRFASLPEAESLGDSVQRWAPSDDMERQPDYLKFVFKIILDIFNEFERELGPEGRSYVVKATIEEFKILVRANVDLLKWTRAANIPSFEAYMEVGEVEIAVYATMAAIFMCMEHIGNEEAYEWLKYRPQIVKSVCAKTRLLNDMTGFKDDIIRGDITTGVNCYMKQYGVTEKEAFTKLSELVAYNENIMNEEFLKKIHLPRHIFKIVINFSRAMSVTYNENDGYTHSYGKIKEYMTSLFVNKIVL